ILLPAAEDVDDQDNPGRQAVPEPPQQVSPPHDGVLLPIGLTARLSARCRSLPAPYHRRPRSGRAQLAVAGNRSVAALQSRKRFRAIGRSLVGLMKATSRKSDRMAPAIVSGRHQARGTQSPATARAARRNASAEVTASQNPVSGEPDLVTVPSGPRLPTAQGQTHRSRPPNAPWLVSSSGTRYDAAKWAWSSNCAVKSQCGIMSPPGSGMVDPRQSLSVRILPRRALRSGCWALA